VEEFMKLDCRVLILSLVMLFMPFFGTAILPADLAVVSAERENEQSNRRSISRLFALVAAVTSISAYAYDIYNLWETLKEGFEAKAKGIGLNLVNPIISGKEWTDKTIGAFPLATFVFSILAALI
jgi:hypothetical protein